MIGRPLSWYDTIISH